MDFIERLFHIAPDGGNGLAELAILLGLACVCIGLLFTRLLIARHDSTNRAVPGDSLGSGKPLK